ncbi:MAG TPA: phospholipase D family protein [Rubrivivax sp.]|nr:phospholipase D family protein [Rubrivivax sp.]
MNATAPPRTPRIGRFGALLLALGLAACASLPEGAPHREAAVPPQPLHDTTLARIAADSTPPAKQALTGLRLLPGGDQAFDARLALAQQAEHTLDLQYYVLADDAAGRQLLRALRDAAGRGVQVRLLLDDLHSGDVAWLLAGLAAYDRIEVRLFNPLPQRAGSPMTRLLLSPNQFEQLNRRMHNKLFIADGQLAISGGRNIGDEYFMRSSAANFVDMDLLTTGAALPALREVFERYWSSAYAYPLQKLLPPAADRDAQRAWFDAGVERGPAPAAPVARDALGQSPLSTQLRQGHLELHFAPVQVLADAPDKVVRASTLDDSALGQGLLRLRAARSEVVIVSPYFIPGARGMAMLREAVQSHVRVSVLTNSMAATDEPVVHHAYARYRQAMLDLGVTIHELSPRLSRKAGVFGDFRSSDGRLHAKVALADRRWVLMGSMNMDGRSAYANTELGLLIDSPELAWELRSLMQQAYASSSYRVRRAGPALEWVARDGGTEVVQFDEPGAAFSLRLKTALLSLLVAEDLL